ncbi:MAG: HD domain-containing protein [Planctomycetaceae bacterium]|nr:HD domain-containing protein [Planctomycetaceae bacterium]
MTDSSPYRQPQYLKGGQHEPVHRIRCAVHGFIRYSDSERSIIDHDLFRRLRYIRQLALTELVYPGATHTRFEHSLGVMEMATRIFDRLASREGSLMEAVFKEIPELGHETMARARQVCRLAGLLHDVGHCCFSHAAEKVLHKTSGHEQLSIDVIHAEELLGTTIDQLFFPGCAKIVASLIEGPAPQLQILSEIVTGQIDADRTDYLLRDSHHCGVDYGRFDYRRLIECLTVWQDEPGGALEMAVYRDGVHSFESLILARYQMNTQVYYHRLRRIYDLYLENYFRELDPQKFDSNEKVLALNDIRATVDLMDAALDDSIPGHRWASRIVHRNHHRDVFALDEREGSLAVKKIAKVLKSIGEEFSDIDFLDDLPEKTVSIHKIACPTDQRDDRIDFPLIDRGKRFSLGERSQLLEKLPGEFRIGYIFADISDREMKEKIANRCREIYQNV